MSRSFLLENLDTGTCPMPEVATQIVAGKTVATLTFSGADFIGGSLADGNYRLTTLDTITDGSGTPLDGNGDGTLRRSNGRFLSSLWPRHRGWTRKCT